MITGINYPLLNSSSCKRSNYNTYVSYKKPSRGNTLVTRNQIDAREKILKNRTFAQTTSHSTFKELQKSRLKPTQCSLPSLLQCAPFTSGVKVITSINCPLLNSSKWKRRNYNTYVSDWSVKKISKTENLLKQLLTPHLRNLKNHALNLLDYSLPSLLQRD